MDGVLVDSEVHWRRLEDSFLRSMVPHWNAELQQLVLGMSAYDVHEFLCRKHGLDITRSEFVGRYHDVAQLVYGERCSLIDGAQTTLSALKNSNINIGLASSSPRPWIDMMVDRFSIRSFFNKIISSDDIEGRSKPEPEIYLKAAKLLGVDPKNCLAIEDSEKGIASATRAGMYCIGFKNGFNEHQDLSRADTVIDGFKEFKLP
jgi:HAD superfamily hydrolase (TIGR01509 family)